MPIPPPHFDLSVGSPLPFGAHWQNGYYNFSLYCNHAASIVLLFYERHSKCLVAELPLHCTGKVWHIALKGVDPSWYYVYRIVNFPEEFPSERLILDPYAKAVAGRSTWANKEPYLPYGELPQPCAFNWGKEPQKAVAPSDLIIYEMHVRGFTQHQSSNVDHPGSFLAVIEKIPYLLSLGVTAIELLPCQEFDECENIRCNPFSGERLYNFWGYSTIAYFAPMGRYAVGNEPNAAIIQFKEMVKQLHNHGIAVILDIVFNHTAENGALGSIFSFKALDPYRYYMRDSNTGRYLDYTGCGNTFNCNHPIGMQFILDCLRYWVVDMHVDGFRFDLAAIFCRGIHGDVLEWSPLIEAISTDPLLSSVRLIAEPWDAVGLYQVGSFPGEAPWMEWNGRYRDAVRNFIKGTGGKGEFATRLCGSQDMYATYSPLRSINFLTAHDGFTLADLVSYNDKHNLSNSEENRDGTNNNDSWNCGVEGKAEDKEILALRLRQRKNFILALAVSQGIPMLLMGDEYGHTKEGNNNTWCHDDESNWFLWDALERESDFFRFYSSLLAFRRRHPIFSRDRFLLEQDIWWHGIIPYKPRWEESRGFLAFTVSDREKQEEIYIAFNSQDKEVKIIFPRCKRGRWHWISNTSNSTPEDFYNEESAPVVAENRYTMVGYSALVIKAV